MRRRGQWKWVVIALLAAFLSIFLWGISSPPGSSPDDDFHLTSIWCAQGDREGLCENVSSRSVFVPENVVRASCFAKDKGVTQSCQALLNNALVETNRANIVERTYPGGFYWVLSWLADSDVVNSALKMKLLNSFIFIFSCAITALLCAPSLRKSFILAVLFTIVPLGMFLIPSTNPSAWVLFAPVMIFVLTRTLIRSGGQFARDLPVSLGILFIAGIACIARADAAFFAAAAFVLAAVAEHGTWLRRPSFYVVGLLLFTVCTFSVISGAQASAISSGVGDDEILRTSGTLALLVRNLVDLPGLYAGILGASNLGWLDTPIPSFVWVAQILALGALIAIAISGLQAKRDTVAPILGLLLMLAVPLEVLQASGASVGTLVQPRYVLPLLALALVALFSASATPVFQIHKLLAVSFVILSLANAIALTTNVLRYSTGLGSFTNASTLSSTSWIVIVLGSSSFAVFALVTYKLVTTDPVRLPALN